MSVSAADGSHEFVVAPDLAEAAERLGVPLHAGEGSDTPRRHRLSWLGSVSTGEHTLSERAKDDIRTGMGQLGWGNDAEVRILGGLQRSEPCRPSRRRPGSSLPAIP